MKIIIFSFLFHISLFCTTKIIKAQNTTENLIPRYNIGITSFPYGTCVKLKLVHRFQNYNPKPVHKSDIYDITINSPKSVNFTPDGKKFYIHSLEGHSTSVYETKTMNLKSVIQHEFSNSDKELFVKNENSVFNYNYRNNYTDYNIFKGKPVESCMSHKGKYLWVTYYRRDFDINAECPSALAIIDTEKDSIIRIMPTGPLPKMIACSPDNKYIAVTHWGDNTIGIIDVSAESVNDFSYIAHLIVDYKINPVFGDEPVNRDQKCGHCLRGTVFSPDSKHLLVGKMGGTGGIAIFTVPQFEYLGTVTGQKSNIRHMIIHKEEIFISTNNSGYIQKAPLSDIIELKTEFPGKSVVFKEWNSCHVGSGVRTISTDFSGEYIFAAVNNESKIAVIRSSDMKNICNIHADSYPVGLAVSPDNSLMIVTSQGKNDLGGNSVMVFEITYFRWKDEQLLSKTINGLFKGAYNSMII
jgi:hypothetical protein